MKIKSTYCSVTIILIFVVFSYASRIPMSNSEALRNSEVIIVKGKVIGIDKDVVRIAKYVFSVSEVIKPKNVELSQEIRIIDKHYASTAMIELEKNMNVVVYLTKSEDGYISHREINIDTSIGVYEFKGLKLFLELMSIQQINKQTISCVNALKNSKSSFEKKAVLDAMWETRNLQYVSALLNIAKSKEDDRYVRSWAITILAYLEDSSAVKELIPLLKDQSSDVKRQVLVALGIHKIKEAVPKIEFLLTENISEELRQIAQETLKKIKTIDR